MKTKHKLQTAGVTLALLSTLNLQLSTCLAQGTAFTYQGRLNDDANPARGNYDLRFTIYDSSGGPTVVAGPLTNSATSASNGLFAVALDFGSGVFTGAERWLEIAVRTNGVGPFGLLNPRQALTPAPYAIHSGSVNASGISGTIAPANIANGTITTVMLANGAVGSNQLAAGAVTTAALAEGAVTSAKMFTALKLLSTVTLTNPTPLALDQFGFAVAAVSPDQILVGANLDDVGFNNAGAAHLFNAGGNLLVTLTNPTPAADDYFGAAVAALGPGQLLVGAYQDDTGAVNAGSAYLYNTSGTLLRTLTNPSPSVADGFGQAVLSVGSGHFLVAAPRDNPGAGQFGAAYLYDLAGNLVQAFTNPTPANLDLFGIAVAAVGPDKVLIGASSDDTAASGAGTAYLFNTNGTLLTTLTNPTPAASEAFGAAVATVGPDKVLISAPFATTGITDAGAAYLYDLNGNLLTTFTNPAPAAGDGFGNSVTAVGANRVLIGAPTDEAGNAGSAYLFDLSGKLLLTLTNPTPANGDQFGKALTALDETRVVVGSLLDDYGVPDAGGVYVLTIDTFTPGLVADAVRAGGVDSASIAAGAVAATQLAAGSVTTGALAEGAVTAVKVATVSNWFALTLANPTPAFEDYFGFAVAAVGSNRVLIGAYQDDTGTANAGAAYLFTTDGSLLTTFTNPTPAIADFFGVSVAAVGSDRVLIGAYNDDMGAINAGSAYLFSTNGTLLTTFTNPTPSAGDYFGWSMAAVGSDRVLIGAYQDDTGASDAGAAYLFSTNGTLLTTFTNPTPAMNDYFGFSVAAVGSDRVLIGAYQDDTGTANAGAAYTFSTNGTLLTTFTNPTPALNDYFGFSVAAVGSDRVLIGAYQDDTGTANAGAAYMFSTNGTLLTTFTNPTPAFEDFFGYSVAAVGSDRVLIGAYYDDTGAINAGSAYLFGTNGTLLTTFASPTLAAGDLFGFSVAAVGSDRVLIGAFLDDTGASGAGAAYLFSTETFTDGLVADAVRARSVTTASLEDGAVTLAKLDPAIGIWTRSGTTVFREEGRVGIGTNSPQQALHVIGNILASGTVTGSSDRNGKRDLAPVNGRDVLEKVAGLPISTWSYVAGDGVRHLGPMAQDFYSAFSVGLNDKTISMVDADGVALAAIQGLNEKVESGKQNAETQFEELKAENAELKRELQTLKQLVGSWAGKRNGDTK